MHWVMSWNGDMIPGSTFPCIPGLFFIYTPWKLSWDLKRWNFKAGQLALRFKAGRPCTAHVHSMFQLILFLIVLGCFCSTHITKNLPRVLGDMTFAYFCFLFFTGWDVSPRGFSGSGNKSGFGSTLCWQYMIPLYTYYIPLIYHLCSALVWGGYISHPWNVTWTPGHPELLCF